MVIQIFRFLDALVGGDAEACFTWMNAFNTAIGDLPKQAIQTLSGLKQTLAYLNGLMAAALGGQARRLQ